MERLQPLQKLDGDYYVGETYRDGPDSDDEMSSDDEIKQELRKLAGIRRECRVDGATGRQRRLSEFEDDMENELDRSITDYANEYMGGGIQQEESAVKIEEIFDDHEMPALEAPDASMDTSEVPSSSSKTVKSPLKSCLKEKKEKIVTEETKDDEMSDEEAEEGEEENPIRKMAKQRQKESKKEKTDFYDADEDDDNERWVQKHRQKTVASDDAETEKKLKQSRPKIDDGSDAVLSCPGCMSLLTRDCQRHELYNDQYRAMFVENCAIDREEQLTIEKSGKEKRRERQKLRKQGVDPATIKTCSDDVFLPVRCRVCTTKVAVMDSDEVYHFFNVLSGYA